MGWGGEQNQEAEVIVGAKEKGKRQKAKGKR
jgi:hypothetical protein